MPYTDPKKNAACSLKREKDPTRIAYRKQWRTQAGINASRKYSWKTQYGITPEDYARIAASQGGGCAICGKHPKDGKVLVVDHDHVTKKIRGLLCNGCNISLGMLGDSIAGLSRAIQYLSSFDKIE